jgi:hypothetical protein
MNIASVPRIKSALNLFVHAILIYYSCYRLQKRVLEFKSHVIFLASILFISEVFPRRFRSLMAIVPGTHIPPSVRKPTKFTIYLKVSPFLLNTWHYPPYQVQNFEMKMTAFWKYRCVVSLKQTEVRTASTIRAMMQYAPPKRRSTSTRLHSDFPRSLSSSYSPSWEPEISWNLQGLWIYRMR